MRDNERKNPLSENSPRFEQNRRHLLWAFPEPDQVLTCWMKLLNPGARLVLVEGHWGSVVLHDDDILKILPATLTNISVQDLSDNEKLWGKPVADERYVMIGDII